MKTGLAAQSTAVFSGEQQAENASSDTTTSEERSIPVRNKPVTNSNARVEVDPGRANSPVLDTGKSTSQSSVVNSLPKPVAKDSKPQEKRLPWEQQSAQQKTATTTSSSTPAKENTMPWSQQSSAKENEVPDQGKDTVSSAKEGMPWSQQSAEKTTDSSGTKTKDKSNASSMPWQQQSSAKSDSGVTQTSSSDNVDETSESRIRRVVIDPVTGLYIETSLSSLNNPASGSKNMSFENRQEDLLEWPFWEMDGRIGLTVAKDSYNGSVSWDQNGEAIDFRFRGPLGIGGLRIHGELDQEVRVKTTTGQDFTVSDFETEMQERMGWSIPINSLRYWALGIVDPEVDADVVLNDKDLLDELVQGDWKVIYERYQDVDGVDLPKKFKITGPETRIKMIVNDWTIPGSE